jgi:hypothetical protein
MGTSSMYCLLASSMYCLLVSAVVEADCWDRVSGDLRVAEAWGWGPRASVSPACQLVRYTPGCIGTA